MMEVYPIYLNRLDKKKTVLIGGDHEAERKTGELLERNARLTVISPRLTGSMEKWAAEARLNWIQRNYRTGDLKGAFMVIVAEFEGTVNEQVYREAEQEGILVNVMDDIPHCNFTFGSIVKRGPLTLSISTSGAAPTLAVRLRERFEKEFGEEYVPFLQFMQDLRKPMADTYPDFDKRKDLWYSLVDSGMLTCFGKQDYEGAYKIASEIVGEAVVQKTFE